MSENERKVALEEGDIERAWRCAEHAIAAGKDGVVEFSRALVEIAWIRATWEGGPFEWNGSEIRADTRKKCTVTLRPPRPGAS